VCGSAASTGLCGGRRVTAVPTATQLMQLSFGAVVEVRLEFIQEILLGHALIVVLLQCLVNPADDGEAQHAAGEHFL